jgi:hypothetical protein
MALFIMTACLLHGPLAWTQEQPPSPPAGATAVTVPRLVRITGVLHDAAGNPLTGNAAVTFSFYKDQNDQQAAWQEVQNVQPDSAGHYSVLLGAMSESGLPLEMFFSGEARWLGVRPDGQPEQPRILFVSVAYALKAADADMLGGRPASSFVLAANQGPPGQSASIATTTGAQPFLVAPATACSAITSDGTATANQLSKFTSACNIGNSAIFESGGNVGIGNTSPAGMLDVSGTAFVRGEISALAGVAVGPVSAATASQGYTSSPLDLQASVFNTTLGNPVNYLYRWQSEPTGNNSTNTNATLNLLYGVSGDVLETGLSINRTGIITFAPGQTFPALGTVTSVATGAGLTGGPITKTGTISIATGGVTNSLLANPSITVKAGSGLSGGGTVALGGTVTLTNASPSSGGTVTSVATGTGLTGGTITSTGTLSLNTGYTDARYLLLGGGTLTGALSGTTATFTGPLKATTGNFAGTMTSYGALMPVKGTATATTAFNSNPFDLMASSFSSTKSAAVTQDFRWQAEPTGSNTSTPSGKLNLLFGSGGATPAETGLSVASNGRITFAAGQTFPGAGTGTVTSVATGVGLTGGTITNAGTISIATGGVTNSLLANSSITVNAGSGLSGGGAVALGGTISLTNASPSSGGTVTSVATGTGLTGGTITKTGTLSLNTGYTDGRYLQLSGGALSGGLAGTTASFTGALKASSGTFTGPMTVAGAVLPVQGTATAQQSFSSNPLDLVASSFSSAKSAAIAQDFRWQAQPVGNDSSSPSGTLNLLFGAGGATPAQTGFSIASNGVVTFASGQTFPGTAAGPTLPFFATGGERTGGSLGATKNVTTLWGFLLPYNVTTTQMTYQVTTADKTANEYDIGIFDNSGNLVLAIGPTAGTTFAAVTGFNTLAWTQGSVTLPAGRYYLAFTTNCASSCAAIGADTSFVSFAANVSAGATTGGALPSTVSTPTDAWSTGDQPTIIIH